MLRQQPFLVIDHDQVERAIVEGKLVQIPGLDFEQDARLLRASAGASRVRFRRYDRTRATAQPNLRADCAEQR